MFETVLRWEDLIAIVPVKGSDGVIAHEEHFGYEPDYFGGFTNFRMVRHRFTELWEIELEQNGLAAVLVEDGSFQAMPTLELDMLGGQTGHFGLVSG